MQCNPAQFGVRIDVQTPDKVAAGARVREVAVSGSDEATRQRCAARVRARAEEYKLAAQSTYAACMPLQLDAASTSGSTPC